MILRRAVVRLAIAFSLVQLAFAAFAAIGVYAFVSLTFDRDEAVPPTPPGEFDAADHALERLRLGLLLVYGVLILVIPLVSYVMARLALAPVRRNYELQEQFIDAASHEFRTPLGVAVGELSLALTRERSEEEYRSAIARSLEAVEGLSTLTNQLLLLSRGDTASLEAERESLPVAELVHQAVTGLPERAEGSPHITTEVSAGLTVWGSAELLVNALRNVIDNACKYTDHSGTITVSALAHGATVVISVSDTGRGMTRNELDHAFERFWRAPSATGIPGHGVGLALVRSIVAAHGGRAEIASAPGKGTTVTLTLPGNPH